MKKTTFALAAGIALLAFAACKKSSNSAAVSPFVGTWQLHQEITDTNNNGKMDAGDETDIEDSLGYILQINNNGTGVNTILGFTIPFTWKLINNNTYIEITDTSTGSSYYMITALSATSFTIEDTTQHPLQWDVFNKK